MAFSGGGLQDVFVASSALLRQVGGKGGDADDDSLTVPDGSRSGCRHRARHLSGMRHAHLRARERQRVHMRERLRW